MAGPGFAGRSAAIGALAAVAVSLLLPATGSAATSPPARPNVIIIMADDMGFSDIGCYGSEIPTPNIDALAANGLRFTQFYNSARCSPTRAALLTGLHPHQAGMGELAESPGSPLNSEAAPGYTKFLNANCVTLAEVLKPSGYHTYLAGKWHLGQTGEAKWPLQRGFERYYGMLAGSGSYFRPTGLRGLTLDNQPLPPPEAPDYYTTDAFTDYALRFLGEQKDNAPFFLYLAFNAPHWPLHARAEDVARFVGRYRAGWDQMRPERNARVRSLGLLSAVTPVAPRDEDVRAWDTLTEEQKTEMDYRMAVYAAQISRMDWNVGRLVEHLRKQGQLDNTVILFLSDNGACDEPGNDLGSGHRSAINDPAAGGLGNANPAGGSSYGRGWANFSNTPFRRFKSHLHEGGIATPLVVHWPHGLRTKAGGIVTAPGSINDVMPTVLDLSGATYPTERHGVKIFPLEGRSLLPLFTADEPPAPRWFFWEQYNNKAVRHGDWKAIQPAKSKEWELYDLAADRTELHNLASERPDILQKLAAAWLEWAGTHQVLPK
jgi:arylsulfatase A-like enzyme